MMSTVQSLRVRRINIEDLMDKFFGKPCKNRIVKRAH
jgi:hypothetical protein